MFENLSERLGGVFDRLTKQGALSDADVATALREVRVALLEADVSLPVARDFIKRHEADIVPVARVFVAGVSLACNDQHGSLTFGSCLRSPEKPGHRRSQVR